MRTYLTRLSVTAAGVVLTGVSLTGVAHAGAGDDNTFLDPSVLEDIPSLQPCHEVTASEDMVLVPLDPNEPHTPLPPGEIELVPCYQLPTDPGDDDGNGGGDDGDDDGNGGNSGGGNGGQSGQGNGGTDGQSDGEPSDDPANGVGDEGSADTADDATSEAQETVTPTAATRNEDNGALMLAVLAGVLGALGLFLLTYGLRKRPRRGQQPVR